MEQTAERSSIIPLPHLLGQVFDKMMISCCRDIFSSESVDDKKRGNLLLFSTLVETYLPTFWLDTLVRVIKAKASRRNVGR